MAGSSGPTFSGRFSDFAEFAEDAEAHFVARTGLPWASLASGPALEAALAMALTDDTLATVLAARGERDARLLAEGAAWQAGGLGLWQALQAVYMQFAPTSQPFTEAQFHVCCDARTHTLCPHCKVRARRLLDLAQLRRWGLVFAELALDERLVNYLPEERERPEDPSRERGLFSFGHWAAFYGDADAVLALGRLRRFRPSLETRKGRVASEVASDVARARQSLRHARCAALLDDLEARADEAQPPTRRSYATESRQAFAPPPAAAAAAAGRAPVAAERDERSAELAIHGSGTHPDLRREAPYRWPDATLGNWPEGFRRGAVGPAASGCIKR
ncbi:hypothetical protein T492DRAFT_985652 [Pavlovales sp. CCMP2436]|nr:hypothetical protein T492DRAFT_985652 [Pavlovales sp. CCMP2436]